MDCTPSDNEWKSVVYGKAGGFVAVSYNGTETGNRVMRRINSEFFS